ncbi:MAG TPA: polymer-forming cytoskeletal protein [Myxococcota bacterium]|nr:polymer-forming cytoskeletal protein [Myxococcota bacterium]
MADRITEIGPASLVKGEIEAQEDVSVFGRVEGIVKSTETVTIEEEGLVDGEIEAANVVVAGVMIGNIRATARVDVLETGVVQGDIATPVMVLLDGGAIKGRLVMDDSAPEPVRVNTTGTRSRPAAGRVTGQPTVSRTAPRPAAQTKSTGATGRATVAARTDVKSRPTASRRYAEEPAPVEPSRRDTDLLDGND